MRYRQARLDGKLISVYINRFPFAFVVRNEIKTADDLKGKRLAISRFGSSSDVTTRMLLRHFKLDPDKDVKIIQAADDSPSSHGRWSARRHAARHLRCAESFRIRLLPCARRHAGDADRLRPLRPSRTDTAAKDEARPIAKICRGLDRRRLRFQNQQGVGPDCSQSRRVKGSEYSYPRVAAAMRERPFPETKGVQAVMDSVKTAKSKVVLAKDVMDGSLIEEIDKSGFIAKLYGK